MFLRTLLGAFLLALPAFALPSHTSRAADTDRKVFAHYMLGLTSGQSADQWTKDFTAAHTAGIDGFALNAGPTDAWTDTQLQLAFATAESFNAANSAQFKLFLSFDMACCGDWPVDKVSTTINNHKASSAHFTVGGKPFVSTFEGPAWSANWASVRGATGGIFLVPDWSSLGAAGVGGKLGLIDGAFSWNAWPAAGSTKMTNSDDLAYISALAGKPYMMGVSPWFYTDLPQYNKNWNSDGDTLWFDRWEQVIDTLPQYVEIITWNDYGESSYISEIVTGAIVSGAEGYVNGFPHEAFQFVLPYYTAAYKAGSRNVPITKEGALAWYRTTPAAACGTGGTVCGQGGSQPATACTQDSVSVLVAASAASTVSVKIGGVGQDFPVTAGIHLVQLPFSGRTGAVTVTINGKTATGPAISNTCPATGHVNFNAVAIQTA